VRAVDAHAPAAPADLIGLRLSTLFFWPFVAITLVLMLDPFNPGYEMGGVNLRLPRDLGPIKYLGLAFGWVAWMLSLAGQRYNNTRRPSQQRESPFLYSWPLMLCFGFILLGSLYARWVLDIQETFLPAALGMTAYFIGLAYALDVRDPATPVRGYFALLTLAAFYMVWQIADRWASGGQAFHEEIFLLVPLAVYGMLINERKWIGWLGLFGALGVTVLSYKNTSYMMAALTVGYLLVLGAQAFRRNYAGLQRVVLGYGIVLVLAVVLVALVGVFLYYQEQLPSGSASVRRQMYRLALERFAEGPLYGDAFASSSLLELWLYGGAVYDKHTALTHSDFMDMLAHGGVIGLLLFLGALYVPLRLAVPHLFRERDRRRRAALHGLTVVFLGGILVMMFNPILVNLPINALFWLTAGLLAGLGWRLRESPPTDPRRPPS
jgi:hypothetical protein